MNWLIAGDHIDPLPPQGYDPDAPLVDIPKFIKQVKK
jgi:hypothetical protein